MIRKMRNRVRTFVRKNPVRITAWVSSTVALLVTALAPEMPVEPVVIFVLSTLGLGEYAQRVEDKKTLEAKETGSTDL